MKAFILALLFTGPALADPALLYPSNCGPTRICAGVNNAGGYNILLYASTAYPSVQLIVDGTSYSSPTGNADNINSLPLQSLDGTVIYLTASFVGVKQWTGSGRGRRLATFWTLTTGQIDGLMSSPNPFGAEAIAPADGGCGGCHR